MAKNVNLEARLALLCRRLGSLCIEVDALNRDLMVSKEKLGECSLRVFGKFYTIPNINYWAFLTTMKKAWKVDLVFLTQYESGILSFTFSNELDKNRQLLILTPWVPNKPPHCYKFTSHAFWIQVHGLPMEWCLVEMVSHIIQILGAVQEVKIEKKGVAFHGVGRARVVLNLDSPLSPGTLIYYLCGKIGHYTTNCPEIPYDETKYGDHCYKMEEDEVISESPLRSTYVRYLEIEKAGKVEQGTRSSQKLTETVVATNDQGKQLVLCGKKVRTGESESVGQAIDGSKLKGHSNHKGTIVVPSTKKLKRG
ncbi:hypothetical protein BT93_H2420 [Corymbia citriodora subsp. variegata]|nr:hypothetical protein BT93_H2420 [Corymbia citriodora subsp. variegata]